MSKKDAWERYGLLILRCLCYCAQCDYGLFGGGLSVIVNNKYLHFTCHSVDTSCYVSV